MSEEIKSNLANIRQSIKSACDRANRKETEITLVAVSKRQPVDKIKTYLEVNKKAVIGENYVQEYRDKLSELNTPHTCHLIGALQSNKAKLAVELFDSIETIHSTKLVKALEKELAKANKEMTALVQVNISNDSEKSGLGVEEVKDFILENFSAESPLKFSGLMCITRFYSNPEDVRPDFQKMKSLKNELETNPSIQKLLGGRKFELSMGMSSDFHIAIEEGATIVRVGSSIFGARA